MIKNGGRIEKFYFLFFLFDWEWKSEGMKKISLNKFTHIPLLKNDVQLKQKSDTNPQKRAITQIYYKKKKLCPKKNLI